MKRLTGWLSALLGLSLCMGGCGCSKKEAAADSTTVQTSSLQKSESAQHSSLNSQPDSTQQTAATPAEKAARSDSIRQLQAEMEADVTGFDENELRALFYSQPLSEEMIARLDGDQIDRNADYISMNDYRLVRVLYCDFEGRTKVGEILCNQLISTDLENILFELYQNAYPIGRVVLPYGYGMDDESITAANITRSTGTVWNEDGTSYPQEHSMGLAIDFNSLYNPQHVTEDGQDICYPEAGRQYLERNGEPHRIDPNDLAYQIFTKYGFNWGGYWDGRNDYQHFEKFFNHDTNQVDTSVVFGAY